MNMGQTHLLFLLCCAMGPVVGGPHAATKFSCFLWGEIKANLERAYGCQLNFSHAGSLS